MGLISIQILLINFIVAGVVSAVIYFSNKKIRHFNPILLFVISSIGTFLGTSVAMFFPDLFLFSDSIFLKGIIYVVPGIVLSSLFLCIWIRGCRTEGYF